MPTTMASHSLRTTTSRAAGFRPFYGKPKPDRSWWLQSISRPMKRSKGQPTRSSLDDFWLSSRPPIGSTSSWVTGTGTPASSRVQCWVPNSTGSRQILAPDATLLNGNVVDYALIHNQLAPLTSMTTEWAVPRRPHCLVTYAVELPDDFRNYNQLRTFPALPELPAPGFRPWTPTTYVSQVEDLQLYDAEPNPSARPLADWVSITEQYLLQQHPWAPQGRASNLQAVFQPLASAKTGPIWKKGKPAYWEQLQARLNLISHQVQPTQGAIRGYLKAIESVPKHWTGEPTWAQFLDTAQHWDKRRDPRTMELMQHTIHHQLTQAQEQSRTETQLQYAAWIRQGEAKGLRGLFRNLKASELSWQRPYRHIPMADRMRHRLHDWHQLWQPTADNQPMARQTLHEEAQVHAAQLPPLTVGQLARALKKLPDSGMHRLTHFPACLSSSRTWKPPPPYPHNSR